MFYFLNIRVATLKMQRPLINGTVVERRIAGSKTKATEQLISYEEFLRKQAYKRTPIHTSASFFNDSDMRSAYYLVIIYDKKSATPLLSARYYFDKSVIDACLKGEATPVTAQSVSIDINAFAEGELFLSDRLSGNTSSAIYRRYRQYIFLLFYSEILLRNKNRSYILMAREERHNKLLKKYLQLGLHVVGNSLHKGIKHRILFGNTHKSYARVKQNILFRTILIVRKLFNNN